MYLKDLVGAVRRRWYALVAGLLITVGLVVMTFAAIPPSYTATTSMLLIPPKSVVGPRGNPYLSLGGLGPALDVLTARVIASTSTQQLVSANPKSELTVAPDATTTGPILLISVTARDRHESMALRDTLASRISPTLTEMQDDLAVPDLSRIGIATLAIDPKPTRDIKDQLRAAIVVVALAGAGTIILVGLLDKFMVRRVGRRSSSPRRGARETDAPSEWTVDPSPRTSAERTERQRRHGDDDKPMDLDRAVLTSASRARSDG